MRLTQCRVLLGVLAALCAVVVHVQGACGRSLTHSSPFKTPAGRSSGRTLGGREGKGSFFRWVPALFISLCSLVACFFSFFLFFSGSILRNGHHHLVGDEGRRVIHGVHADAYARQFPTCRSAHAWIESSGTLLDSFASTL